jgi:cell division septation protein DedD
VGSVAQGEAVSHFDALKLIEKERENIIYQLDKGEKVTLAETGELFVDDKNEIGFTPFEDENLLLDSFGLEAVELEEVADENRDVVIAPETTEPEKVEVEKEEVAAVIPEKETPEKVEKPKEEIVEPEPVTSDTNDDKEKKKRGGFWFLLILVPILFVGFFLYQRNSENKQPEVIKATKPEVVAKKQPVATPDTIAVDSTSPVVKDTLQTEIKTEPAAKTETPGSGKYILVGGSFKAEENANNYLIELKEKGFEPFALGKRGNFYIIGIGKYNTEKEALAAKRKFMDENPKSGLWLMKNK